MRSVIDTDVFVSWEKGLLRGTLTRPITDPGPLAVMIPGSGAIDRDGNGPAGIGNSMYRKLAVELSNKGISTLRFDKRGTFQSATEGFGPDDVLFDDYVSDVIEWAKYSVTQPTKRSVWLIGHSEGGVVALAAARSPSVSGVVLLNTPGRDLGTLLVDQLSRQGVASELLETVTFIVDDLKSGKRISSDNYPPELEPLFRPSVQPYLTSLFRVRPGSLAERVEQPLLIVSGGRDMQVGEHDARILTEHQPAATWVNLELMNHVLIDMVTDTMEENIKSYTDNTNCVSARLVETIAEFICERQPFNLASRTRRVSQ